MRVIVTGAAGNLGREVTRVLAEKGVEVIAVDHADSGLPETPNTTRLGGVDLADAAQAAAAVATAAKGGSLQGLVNVAGGFAWEKVLGGEAATWDRMWALNVTTALNMCRAAAPALEDGAGSIVNIGAAAAAPAGLGMGAYAASKSAVARLTETLAAELKPRRVRVNAVLPSIIDTPANRKSMPDADPSAWVTTTELAATIAFLLSPDASGVTGALIPVVGRV